MKPWVTKSPQLLMLLRAAIGLGVLTAAVFRFDPAGYVLALLVVFGLLTDVFDGILARKLKVSTPELRILDSWVDIVFFVSLVIAVVVQHPELTWYMGWFFAALAVMELVVHAISFARFRRQSSTHHYLSKVFSIFLFGLIVQLFIFPEITWYYGAVLALGVLSFCESGWIMLSLNEWKSDVRSILDIQKGEIRERSRNDAERSATLGKKKEE